MTTASGKIDTREIRNVIRRMEREGETVGEAKAAVGAALMREKELTDEEVDLLWGLAEDDDSGSSIADDGLAGAPVKPGPILPGRPGHAQAHAGGTAKPSR